MDEILLYIESNLRKDCPTLICIDGIDGAGKTHFALKLKDNLLLKYDDVHICSIDNYHNKRAIRYNRGRLSPKGFYYDSYNYTKIIEEVLNPFKLNQEQFLDSVFDIDKNIQTDSYKKSIAKNGILIVEGIFLQRPELFAFWDIKIFLEISFDTVLNRVLNRQIDKNRLGSSKEIKDTYEKRYIQGQKLYFEEVSPRIKTDILIDNNNYENPKILRIKSP